MKTTWEEIGFGQEAKAFRGLLIEVEGLGGVVESEEGIDIVKRIDWNKPVYKFQGHDIFCKNLVLRILDEYFIKQGKYLENHIPVPLGSFNNSNGCGYYYRHVEGSEGFPLVVIDEDYRKVEVQIDEWNSFTGLFHLFGFELGRDIAEFDDAGVGKNIIMRPWGGEIYKTKELHSNWKRIDFGSSSCDFDYKKFLEKIKKESTELLANLGDYHKLLYLAAKYCEFGEELNKKEEGELEELVLQFRKEKIQENL